MSGRYNEPLRITKVSRDRRGAQWFTCVWADGHTQDMPAELVPVQLLAELVDRLQRRAKAADLGDLRDDLSQLVDDFQAKGRQFFLEQILELNRAESLHRENAAAFRAAGRAALVEEAESTANRARQVRDNCYWVVDTYLGGVDALPNVVPARGGARPAAVRNVPRPPNVGAVPVILGAIGIVSGAALVAWIAHVVQVAVERKQLIDAAKETGDNSFLDPLNEGGTWKFWVGGALVVAALIWGPKLLEKGADRVKKSREAVRKVRDAATA